MEEEKRSNVGALLASYRRNDYSKQCVVCGAEFQGMKKSLYCGEPCKRREYRRRASVPA